jgi:ribosomal protein L29
MANFTDSSDQDLRDTLADKREKLREIRFDITGSKNASQKQKLKQDVARLKTELRKREQSS